MGKLSHGGDIYRNKNVIDYSSNCNPVGTPEGVIRAICQSAENIGHYPDPICEKLKDAIANKLNGANVASGLTSDNASCEMDADHIFIGNGAAEVIYTLALATNPQRALIPAPTFSEYEDALSIHECEITRYEMGADSGYKIQDDILDRIDESIDVVFICSPNNPTGVLTDRKILIRILEKCQQEGALLVLDECFLDFADCPSEQTLIDHISRYDNLVILKAFTKLYAMAGVRLGYCISSNTGLIDRMNNFVQPWNVSTLAQNAGIAALEETEYVKSSLEVIAREKKFLVDGLNSLCIKPLESQGNYLFFRSRYDLYDRLLERGFMIRDCSNYHGLSQGDYRIAVRLHEDNVKLLDTMREILCPK